MFANLITTPHKLVGLQAAANACNSTLQPTKDADGNDVLPVLKTTAEYWDFVFSDYSGTEAEQQVFDRACESYCNQYGVI
jgi:hypothetical protein